MKKKMQKKILVIVTSIHPKLGTSSSSFIVHLYSAENKKYIGFQHSHVLVTILILMHYLTVVEYYWDSLVTIKELGFPGQTIKSVCNVGDLGRSMEGRAWWATVHGVANSRTQLSN